MRKLRLLSTVAAVVLIGAAAASAQDVKKDEAPGRAPAAQQNAPAEKIAPAMKPGAAAQQKAPETTGQAPKPADADKAAPKASDADKAAPDKGKTDKGAMDKGPAAKSSSDVKVSPDVKSSSDTTVKSKANENAQAPAGAKPTQSTTSEKSSNTTGQGAAGGSVNLSTEQRTKITTIIKQQKVERLEPSKLNISVSVGARIPSTVHYYPLPQEVFVIYPEWRGYDYILVGDQIVVIDPRTHQIVAILEA
jgi:uncharacterized protein DUF1236